MDFSKAVDVRNQKICMSDCEGEPTKYGWVVKDSSPMEDPLNLNDDYVHGSEVEGFSSMEEALEAMKSTVNHRDEESWGIVYEHNSAAILIIPPTQIKTKEQIEKEERLYRQFERHEARNLAGMGLGVEAANEYAYESEELYPAEKEENLRNEKVNKFWLEICRLNTLQNLTETLSEENKTKLANLILDSSGKEMDLLFETANFIYLHKDIIHMLMSFTLQCVKPYKFVYRYRFLNLVKQALINRNEYNEKVFVHLI